jgi:hypothetical protein
VLAHLDLFQPFVSRRDFGAGKRRMTMDAQPVTELARAVVAQVAPGELPLFGAMSRAYAADPSRARPRRGGDEALGFGLAEAASLLTPAALAAAGQVARYLADDLGKALANTAGEAIGKRIARLFRREPGAPSLTQAQISRVRAIALEVARAENLTEPRASLLADALVGHLVSAAPAVP